jgi:hypothetical protein
VRTLSRQCNMAFLGNKLSIIGQILNVYDRHPDWRRQRPACRTAGLFALPWCCLGWQSLLPTSQFAAAQHSVSNNNWVVLAGANCRCTSSSSSSSSI